MAKRIDDDLYEPPPPRGGEGDGSPLLPPPPPVDSGEPPPPFGGDRQGIRPPKTRVEEPTTPPYRSPGGGGGGYQNVPPLPRYPDPFSDNPIQGVYGGGDSDLVSGGFGTGEQGAGSHKNLLLTLLDIMDMMPGR